MKTKFGSFCEKGVANGCKYCVRGEKLVLFITGKCSRNCWYCSLSEKRKNKDIIWANEREIRSVKEMIKEAEEGNAKGAGITGGDPLVVFRRTVKFAKALKKRFGSGFHIHIYLPLNLVEERKLKKLNKFVDEVRFHPSFLINPDRELMRREIEKIMMASSIFGKESTGVELPMIPEKKKETLDFLLRVKDFIGFVNLNEFEISETNFERVSRYKMNKDSYTVSKSKEAGLWVLKNLKNSKLKVHLCTAFTKNCYQYKNRLKLHNILPYGMKTDDGTVIYLALYFQDIDDKKKLMNKLKKGFYVDETRARVLLSMDLAVDLIEQGYKVARVEEHPTFDASVMEFWYLSKKDLE